MTDDDGHAWLDEHQERAEKVIYIFYALAALSALRSSFRYAGRNRPVRSPIAVVLLGAAALGSGCYIAYAGGKVRHREFRNEPAPPIKSQEH